MRSLGVVEARGALLAAPIVPVGLSDVFGVGDFVGDGNLDLAHCVRQAASVTAHPQIPVLNCVITPLGSAAHSLIHCVSFRAHPQRYLFENCDTGLVGIGVLDTTMVTVVLGVVVIFTVGVGVFVGVPVYELQCIPQSSKNNGV